MGFSYSGCCCSLAERGSSYKPGSRRFMKRLANRAQRRQLRAIIASQLEPFSDCYVVMSSPAPLEIPVRGSAWKTLGVCGYLEPEPRPDIDAQYLLEEHPAVLDFLQTAQSRCMMSCDTLLEEQDDSDSAGCGVLPMGMRAQAKPRYAKPKRVSYQTASERYREELRCGWVNRTAGTSRSAGPSRELAPGTSLRFF